MGKLTTILKDWKVILLIIFLLLSVWTIQPRLGVQGVAVQSVADNSSAEISNLQSGMIISEIDGQEINSLTDYTQAVSGVGSGDIVTVTTEDETFKIIPQGAGDLGINVKDAPTSNLRKGLDLVGGARVVLKPDSKITDQQFSDATEIIAKRLNVYGLSDVSITQAKGLGGEKYIIIEIAGATREEVEKLVSQQGKFEAKIGGETVFVGGKDIKSVCRSTDCAGIDLRTCGQDSEGVWSCRFSFRVDISQESAQKHADITSKLDVVSESGNQYLSKKLDLYLDDELYDSLFISADLKGQVSTSFTITGPGAGQTKDAAINSALENMKRFQTLLITGSLPVKLNVEKIDIVSPKLGEQFFSSAIMALGAALAAVGAVIFIRYRKLKVAVPIMITGLSEIIIILGFAALIRWNLDLAAIAGILAAVGTGVDHQIVITDEVLRGEASAGSWKQRIKQAFFIIMAAYFTTVVAMTPLIAMGAGMLKGFALTTIAGVSIGVFITRPAFARIIEVLLKE